MLDETAVPAADAATPPSAVERFTARSLQDLLELLGRFQDQPDAQLSATPTGAKVTGSRD